MSAFCNCQKGDSILKLTKRIFSGLLAAMMLFTTAFAVNDSATTKAANALTFAFKPIMAASTTAPLSRPIWQQRRRSSRSVCSLRV